MARQTLLEVLGDGAARFPDGPAVLGRGADGKAALTYSELWNAAGRVAGMLGEVGVRRGDRVALLLHKSVEAIVALYGVMRAGAAYVPLDPFGPARRQAFILSNCDVRVLLAGVDLADTLGEILPDCTVDTLIFPDGEPADDEALGGARLIGRAELSRRSPEPTPAELHDDDLAYILYTSGSTGDPKGVMITHRNSLTFVEWAARCFDLSPEDRVSNHAPLHFDLCTFDIFASHAGGAAVHLVPERAATFPIQIARFLASNRITVWYSVPSILVSLLTRVPLGEYDLRALRTVLYAGEAFPVKHLRRLMEAIPHAEYYNLYGPTETNVCTYQRVEPIPPGDDSPVPIGKAIEGIEVFAVDEAGRIVGPGQSGELLVKGSCVAKGYWGLPERTAATLRQDPRHDDFEDPVYRTGDLVRMRPDGSYLFLSRIDSMVKIRGYRVELGEVEAALLSHPGVRDACVVSVPHAQGTNRLEAVVVRITPAPPSEMDLRAHCKERIPHYMVPELFEFRADLPRTSTGKIDRQKLAREARERSAG